MVTQQQYTNAETNALALQQEFQWLKNVIHTRIDLHLNNESPYESIFQIPPPIHPPKSSLYANFLEHYKLHPAERLIVLLALAPHVDPHILDAFFLKNPLTQRGYPEFGGMKGTIHGGFLPTGETALFLLAGTNLQQRFAFFPMFTKDHFFKSHKILKLDASHKDEPKYAAPLLLTDEIKAILTTGETPKPEFSRDFPAKLISTQLEWEDAVLSPHTTKHLQELQAWIQYEDVLMNEWGLGKRLRPGYKCLFYGPPGTGKTLTATLIGKKVHKDVFRIDLSAVVSKYIGETEKNLEKIFSKAENSQAILFFDEADALFGKRTNVSDSHDRYANQEISFLLQRMEDYKGVVILATNFKHNIDEAFTRRFQAIVHFPMPSPKLRLKLWQQSFSPKSQLEPKINLQDIAQKYELSGGAIMNAIRYASLMALYKNTNIIKRKDLLEAITREYHKEGRTI